MGICSSIRKCKNVETFLSYPVGIFKEVEESQSPEVSLARLQVLYISNGTDSDEERMIIDAQRAYSNLIYDKARYEFEFIPWVKKVWHISNSAKSNWFRKTERKLFFTLEFTFKASYATLIEWAAKASYAELVTDIYLLIANADCLQASPDLKIIHEQADKKIIIIARWGAFTKTILEISNEEIDIIEIGGNDEIVVSTLVNESLPNNFTHDELLYESNVVSKTDLKRKVYLLPVNRLLSFVREAK